jgi:hypothetical protein
MAVLKGPENPMFETIQQFIIDHQGLILSVSVASIVLFLVSLVFIPFAVLRLPADYFLRKKKPLTEAVISPARRLVLVWRALVLVVRNILGILFLILGAILLVLPGPGWLTILVGIALLDFPFKHKLEMKVVSLPVVRNAVNAYRIKKNKPPIRFPEPASPEGSHRGHGGDTEGKKEKK